MAQVGSFPAEKFILLYTRLRGVWATMLVRVQSRAPFFLILAKITYRRTTKQETVTNRLIAFNMLG